VKKKILIVVANYYENIARSLLSSAKNKIKTTGRNLRKKLLIIFLKDFILIGFKQ